MLEVDPFWQFCYPEFNRSPTEAKDAEWFTKEQTQCYTQWQHRSKPC
ncbi:Uncharacterised protein [Vibrio cholerae]|nr:Uncharacterised protein [Vibrio cholerae]CSI79855.1 Uncharacterised protein [Vibrio cholerae]